VPTLLELQRAMNGFMTVGDPAAAAFVIGDGIAPEARLAIYRNTYHGNLVSALRISYPAVKRLVGEDFFEGAARAFIDTHPPRSGYLNDYGAEVGDFLAQFAPSLPYLTDVARLEWAVNSALHAEDALPLDPTRLSALPADCDPIFVAHPSATLMECAYPADTIWRATLDENDNALSAIDLVDGPLNLVVNRGADGVSVARLSADEFNFAKAIFAGVPLLRALDVAKSDMSTSLAAHLAAGRFADIRFEPATSPERPTTSPERNITSQERNVS